MLGLLLQKLLLLGRFILEGRRYVVLLFVLLVFHHLLLQIYQVPQNRVARLSLRGHPLAAVIEKLLIAVLDLL